LSLLIIIEMSALSTPAVTSSSEKFTGRVKWFNNKAGYGFITVTDGPKTGTDIFVHHSSIKVDAQQYKYLVQGEYTEFALSSVASSAHEFQATDVSGIKGGKLMCETRYDARSIRTSYKDQGQQQQQEAPARPRSAKPQSVRPPNDDDTAEWKPARKPKQQVSAAAPTATPTEVKQTTSAGRGAGRGGRSGGRATGGRGGGRATGGRS
jgi:CspA family cold shock protein